MRIAIRAFEEVKRLQANPEEPEDDNPEGEGNLEDEDEEGLATVHEPHLSEDEDTTSKV